MSRGWQIMSELSTQSLPETQAWLQMMVSHPEHLGRSVQFAEQQYGISPEQQIKQQYGISARERLAIYKRGYILRLLACMQADFPVLRKYLGDELFDHFARAYLINTPSSSYTLFELSARFPEFLARTRPVDHTLSDAQAVLLDLPVELARLERAQLEVLRAKGTEGEDEVTELGLADFGLFMGELELKLNPCLKLLVFSLPVLEAYSAVEQGESVGALDKGTYFVALSRVDYRLQMQDLSDWQYYFLLGLNDTRSVQRALDYSSEYSKTGREKTLADFWLWILLASQQQLMHKK